MNVVIIFIYPAFYVYLQGVTQSAQVSLTASYVHVKINNTRVLLSTAPHTKITMNPARSAWSVKHLYTLLLKIYYWS